MAELIAAVAVVAVDIADAEFFVAVVIDCAEFVAWSIFVDGMFVVVFAVVIVTLHDDVTNIYL